MDTPTPLLPLFAVSAILAASSAPAVEINFDPTLAIDMSAALAPDPVPSSATASPAAADSNSDSKPRPTYGHAGAQAWTIGALYANNFRQSNDLNLHFDYSYFLADNFEFAVEVAGWYFAQPGTDTGGVSGSMIFRWHVWHAEDYNWSIFLDAGIGILAAFDEVPDGGTGFDFLPRAGAGFTKRLGDDPNSPRLMLGVRWHHISNARIEGDSRNPGRDAVAAYVAIVFPF